MSTRIAVLCFLGALMAGAGLRGEGCRLFLIGDSIMVQYRPLLQADLPGDWAVDGKRDTAGAPPAAHNLDVPSGENAGDSAMVLAYLQARAARDPIHADVLLLNCGLHDMKSDLKTGARQVPLSDYRKNLHAILAAAAGLRLRVVWVRTTPVVDAVHNRPTMLFFRHATDVAAYNAAADEIMRQAGVPEIDLHGFTARFIPGAYVDHVHYDVPTREKQAAYLTGALQAIWGQSATGARSAPMEGPAAPTPEEKNPLQREPHDAGHAPVTGTASGPRT